jgi:hypothetical protein
MAVKYYERYPNNWGAPNSNYPQGQGQNKTPGNNDGSYFDATLINDIMGFLQGLLSQANITPNDVIDTAQSSQYIDAMKQLTSGYEFKGYIEWDGAAWQLTESSGTIGLSGASTATVPVIQRVSGDPLSAVDMFAQVVATSDKSVVVDYDTQKDKIGLRLSTGPATGDRINFIKYS